MNSKDGKTSVNVKIVILAMFIGGIGTYSAAAPMVDGRFDPYEGYTKGYYVDLNVERYGYAPEQGQLWTYQDASNNLYVCFVQPKSLDDNSYGANAIGWGSAAPSGKNHNLSDLLGSDKTELIIKDEAGMVVLHFVMDYIAIDESVTSGNPYVSSGLQGGSESGFYKGDGDLIAGEVSSLMEWSTSLEYNFKTYYEFSLTDPDLDLTQTSPPADDDYTNVDADYADWVFEMIYEFKVDGSVLSGNSSVHIEVVHESPNKLGRNKIWPEIDGEIPGTILFVDDDAQGDPGPGDPNVSDPLEDGTAEHPFDAIQEAIDAAADGRVVFVRDGTYRGAGNRDIDFLGKAITVRSESGPDTCIVDCEGTLEDNHRGFFFHNGEDAGSVLNGFTITNGYSNDQVNGGGAICCLQSSPTIVNCIISGNKACRGGGLYCYESNLEAANCQISNNEAFYSDGGGGILSRSGSEPTISDCTISDNSPDGIGTNGGDARLVGSVSIVSNDLTGNGVLQMESGTVLELDECGISCNITGPGTMHVSLTKEATIEDDAIIDLGDLGDPDAMGTIQCDGLLRAKDNSVVSGANMKVSRAIFEGQAVVTGNIITTDVNIPYGQLAVKDMVAFADNDMYAEGDRYIDFDPTKFAGSIQDNRIYVTITEGRNGAPPGLFELRGRDLFCTEPPCEPGIFAVEAVPVFDPNWWTLQRLELVAGARARLTNRFDFQEPYDSGDEEEVAYVKQLVLGPNSVLDTAFNRLYYEGLEAAPTALIKNKPLRGYSLGIITDDSEIEIATRVTSNNDEELGRIHVERLEGHELDPNGVLRIRSFLDSDPNSSTYQRLLAGRAKGLFAKSGEDTIWVWFFYSYLTAGRKAEIMVYLSDVPELLDHDHPLRDEHYMLIGSVPPPPWGRPGAVDNDHFGVFRKFVSCGGLDLRNGVWIELEVIGEPASTKPPIVTPFSSDGGGSTVLVDDWGPAVMCDGICMDINYDTVPTEGDFLMVVGSCGLPAGLEGGDDATACLDGFFSRDGFVDVFDAASWDWALNSGDMFYNYCGVPLIADGEGMAGEEARGGLDPIEELVGSLSDLLIAGKRSTSDNPMQLKLKDGLYVFDDESQYLGAYAPEPDRCGIRVVKDTGGELYQLNSKYGLLRLDDPNEEIVPPGVVAGVSEPRYNSTATVYVGVQGDGETATGRPILDAAFGDEYVYVVPVVIRPTNASLPPYTAAAKLELLDSGYPPYAVAELYYDPPPPGDNQDHNSVREIEVDSAGNVYVLNVHRDNQADTLRRYDPNGAIVSVSLGNPASAEYLPDPIALYVSETVDMVYVASGQYNAADIYSTSVYGFSRTNLSLERSITIHGMQHVTGVTEEPATACLWAVGFNMDEIPDWPLPENPPFYDPYLAKIPYESSSVEAVGISDASHDLALPMSILWTKSPMCGGADINGDGDVTFADFAELGSAWLAEIGEADWNGACNIGIPTDGSIDSEDLATLADHWLDSGCLAP